MSSVKLSALLILAAILTACTSSESIIFSSGRDGNSNIYIMDADGTESNVR